MKMMFALLLMSSTCFGQAIASRRYAEKTPTGFTFGSFTSVAPYNEADGYTVVPDAQIQPANLISDNNQFASTSNFTVIQKTDATTTFTVSGNVGTITTGTGSGQTFKIGSNTGTPCTVADCFEEVQVTQKGGTGTDIVGITLANIANTVEIDAQFNVGSSNATITTLVGGTFTDLSSVGFTLPAAPFTLGISLCNSQASAWVNSGSGWSLITTANIALKYNPNTSGLSGFLPTVKFFTSGAQTWKIANLKTSLFGGTGVRDIHTVNYADGRPYMQGSKATFIATVGGVSGGVTDSVNGIFTYDLISGALTMTGVLVSNRNSGLFLDSSGQVIYDPETNTERFLVPTWASGTTPVIVYAAQSISTDDWLASGVHTAPAMTAMTLPNYSSVYDPGLVCAAWNYSSSTCSKWLIQYTGKVPPDVPAIASSTSDPSSNSWTSVLNDSANSSYEGTGVMRTATGNSGVAYYFGFAGVIGSATRASRIYDSSGSFVGALNVTWPPAAGSDNPPHLNILAYGNTEYLVTFNDNSFAGKNQAMGNWIVATAPKY